jgi:hypothetical protein
MKILEKEFTYKGFIFNQLYRDGKFAIYEQSREDFKVKKYEAVVIESHNGYDLAGQHFPPAEMYPSSTQWGVKGFTLDSYDDALDKVKYLKKVESKKKEK